MISEPYKSFASIVKKYVSPAMLLIGEEMSLVDCVALKSPVLTMTVKGLPLMWLPARVMLKVNTPAFVGTYVALYRPTAPT